MAQIETATNFTLDLVTPERVIESRPVEMVVIPGKEGDFAVLAGHAPMISSLRPGVVRIYEGNAVKDRILVTSGFAEVTQDRCTILATEAFLFSDTLKANIEARRDAALKLHESARDEETKLAMQTELSTAQAIFDAFILECDGK